MYAKVLNKDGKLYYSPVLVLRYKGWSSWFVVFDDTYTKLIKTNYWKNDKQQIQLIDNDLSGYKIIENNLMSIWDFKTLKLCKSRKFNNSLLEEAKKYIKNYYVKDYIDIKNEDDCKLFCDVSMGCHDGYILDLKQLEDEYELLINTTWGCYIRVKAVGHIKTNINDSMIFYDVNATIVDGKTSMKFVCMDSETKEDIAFLVADNISFKAYFEEKKKFSTLTRYEISKDRLSIYNGNKEESIELCNNLIYFYKNSYEFNFFFETEDKITNFVIDKVDSLTEELVDKLKLDGFLLTEISNINLVSSCTELGDIEYCSKNTVYPLWFLIVPALWVIFWLIVQLLNPQMKWLIFYVMGLIPFLTVFLLISILFLFKGRNNAFIFVCDEGIVISRLYKHKCIKFEDISEIMNENKIIIYTDKKHKLPTTKDKNKLYDEIVKNFEIYKLKKVNSQ